MAWVEMRSGGGPVKICPKRLARQGSRGSGGETWRECEAEQVGAYAEASSCCQERLTAGTGGDAREKGVECTEGVGRGRGCKH